MKKYLLLGACCISILLTLSGCGDQKSYDMLLKDPSSNSGITVNHSVFNNLLIQYVNEKGRVNYRAWKAQDEDTLRDYVRALGQIDPTALSRNEKLAFWINAYNALTLQGILEFYPLKSIKDKVNYVVGFNIWEDYPMAVQGVEYSLNEIEHKILRQMDEPRIHFAIVCAAIGCPDLWNQAFTGSEIEPQLEKRTKRFFGQLKNFKVDWTGDTIFINPILDWFKEDFGTNDAAVIDFIKPYVVVPEEIEVIHKPEVKIDYLEYDWGINEQEYLEQ